jgi:hypothetical protein
MVRTAKRENLWKMSWRQLEKRENHLQAEAGKVYSQMQKHSHKSKQYRALQKRGNLIVDERDKTRNIAKSKKVSRGKK